MILCVKPKQMPAAPRAYYSISIYLLLIWFNISFFLLSPQWLACGMSLRLESLISAAWHCVAAHSYAIARADVSRRICIAPARARAARA